MFLPTRLEQVNDYSNEASREFLRVLGNQANPDNNPYLKLAHMVGDYTKAKDQEGLNQAVGEFQRGLEQGRAVGDILAMINPRYQGDSRFIGNTNKARNAKNNDERIKIDWKNADSNRMQAEASRAQAATSAANAALARRKYEADLAAARLVAQFYRKRAEGGEILDNTFLKRHEAELLANPEAYKQITSMMPAKSLAMPMSPEDLKVTIGADGTVNGLNPALDGNLVQAKMATGLKNGNLLKGKFSWVGQIPADAAKAIDAGDEAAVAKQIKEVWGDDPADMEEIYEAWGNAYRQAQNLIGDSGIPKSVILSEFLKVAKNPGFLDFGLRSKYDPNAFASSLKALKATFPIVQDLLPQMQKDTATLEAAVKNGTVAAVEKEFDMAQMIIMNAVRSGDMTPEQANLEIAKAAKKRRDTLAPLVQAAERNRASADAWDKASASQAEKTMSAIKNAGTQGSQNVKIPDFKSPLIYSDH